MVKVARAFRLLRPFKALVLGDFLLDTYTLGKVRRISPEAPVPIMEVFSQEAKAGGAGNVVLNLLYLGAQVFAMGRLGDDLHGKTLKSLLKDANTEFLFLERGYQTPVKNRLVADSQQIVRVDFEKITSNSKELDSRIIQELKELIPQVDVIALSDYGKGFLTDSVIEFTLSFSKKHHIPTVVDPKGTQFEKYRGAFILKPNLSEAYAAAKCGLDVGLDEVAEKLKGLSEVLLITRSELGMSIFSSKGRSDFPVQSKQVKDVTGAGDTVLATICLSLASGLSIEDAAQLANISAGISIEQLGCAQVTLSQLAKRLLEEDSDTKILDENHTYALSQVLQGRRYCLLVLEKGQEMSNDLFRALRSLKEKKGFLVIYVKDAHLDDEFVHFLASLQEVDCIILQTESLKNLCSTIYPEEIFLLKNGRPVSFDLAKELLISVLTSASNLPRSSSFSS